MNAYEERLQARKERLEARAGTAAARSDAAYNRSRKATEGIVMGQPILVGHHSEGRHRRDLARSENAMRQSWEESQKAQHYAAKAASVGTGGISSDDPEAVRKLREELAELQKSQELMKAANKAIRVNKTPEAQLAALVALGFSAESAAGLLRPDFARRIGFPAYKLSNQNANIRRIEARIKDLEQHAQRESKSVEAEGYTYHEDTEENRVMFRFEGKPDEAIRSALKAQAFKWSPSRGAWVRQLNGNGIYAASLVIQQLAKIAEKTTENA